MSTGKRIGFVDHQLDNFHANVYLKLFRGELAGRGYSVAACTGSDPAEGQAWAAKNEVPWFESAAAMDAHVDVYAVLAPSNPELHLPLCEAVAPLGKPMFVDKTFAPDAATAEKIFALADRHGIAMQTTSALRNTDVQRYVTEHGGREALRHMVAFGGGRSFGEYAIHPTEMVISCMGPEVASVMRRGDEPWSQVLLNFKDGRTAVVNVYTNAAGLYAATLSTNDATTWITVEGGRLFRDAAEAILDFFDAGKPLIDRQESLMIRRILDVAQSPAAREGFVGL